MVAAAPCALDGSGHDDAPHRGFADVGQPTTMARDAQVPRAGPAPEVERLGRALDGDRACQAPHGMSGTKVSSTWPVSSDGRVVDRASAVDWPSRTWPMEKPKPQGRDECDDATKLNPRRHAAMSLQPPPLPKSLRDLNAWRVFADALLEREDRLGHLINADLGLPERPSRAQLESFQPLAARRCWRSRSLTGVEWILGMARTLIVRPYPPNTIIFSRRRGPPCVREEALREAAELVLQPAFSRLEAIRLGLGPPSLGRSFDRLMHRLPPSCIRLELETDGFDAEALREVATALPTRFSELRIGVVDPSILERLGPGLLAFESTNTLAAEDVTRLVDLAPKCNQLIVGGISSAACRELGEARLRLGRSGDGAFIDPETGAGCVLRRTSVDVLQRRFGTLGARAQLARAVPEKWSIRPPAGGVGLETVPSGFGNVMRHSDGSWTLAEAPNSTMQLRVGGNEGTSGPVQLIDGSVVRLNSRPWQFSVQS